METLAAEKRRKPQGEKDKVDKKKLTSRKKNTHEISEQNTRKEGRRLRVVGTLLF